MTYIPGFGTGPVPASPVYGVDGPEVLSNSEEPMIYTTTGPLKAQNGIAFSVDSVIFDPSQVTEGDLDCGIFGN